MTNSSKAKIFLASERGHDESNWFRQYSTFNFGNYQSEHKMPFGALYGWNDITLGERKRFRTLIEEDSLLFLLPVVGAIQYKDDKGNDYLLQAGQSLLYPVIKGTTIEISNPYENSLVNFLQGWIRKDDLQISLPGITSFSLDKAKNSLVEIINPQAGLKCLLGKFDGRAEGNLKITQSGNQLFVFVVQGAFEVQNRLLENRDGLALWDVETLEFEALSNEAILLLVEMMASGEKES